MKKRLLVLLTAVALMVVMLAMSVAPAFAAAQPAYVCTKTGELTVLVRPSYKHSFVKQGYECVKLEQRR